MKARNIQSYLKRLAKTIILSSMIIFLTGCGTSTPEEKNFRKYFVNKGFQVQTTEGWIVLEYDGILLSNEDYDGMVEK